ncbi:MAG: zinc-binding dehydrogenase [Chloroflexota bacterium]|nr:zinc-binding dehydrogenase [Chloroflexota bacterium]
MRALVYQGPWTMTLEEVPEPVAGTGEVVIAVQAVGICGSDIHGYTGSTGRRTPPMIMGHEFGGIITDVGEGVTTVKPGDEVVATPIFPHNGIGQRRVLGVFSTPGAYAERVVVHASMLLPKPAHVSWRQAAMCEPLAVALHAISRTPIPLLGTVAIVGAGTIGLLTLLAARLAGAGKIIISDQSVHRLEMAEELGADLAVNIKTQDPVQTILDFTGGRGVDVAIEAVGIAPAVQQAHKITRNGGHVTWIGNSAKMIDLDMQEVVARELTVRGTYGFSAEFPLALAAIARGRLNIEPLIERIAGLEAGPQLIHDLAAGELDLVKVILEP